MRGLLSGLGILLVLAGAFWALQGAGLVMWPASSFMLQKQSWIAYGIATMAAGIALIVVGRRRRR